MARTTIDTKNYPMFVQIDSRTPVDFEFLKSKNVKGVVMRACDGKQIKDGSPYKMTNYQDDMFAENISRCYQYGLYALPEFTIRFGSEYPRDEKNPEEDLQLKPFLYALNNKAAKTSFQAIVLKCTETGTNTNTNIMEAIRFYYNQFVARFGVRVIIETTLGFLELTSATVTMIAQGGKNQDGSYKAYPLLIKSDRFTSGVVSCDADITAGHVIETPGNFEPGAGLFWDEAVVSGLDDSNLPLIRWWGSESSMFDWFGCKPKNYGSATTPTEPETPTDPEAPATSTDNTAVLAQLATMAANQTAILTQLTIVNANVLAIKAVTDGIAGL